MDQEMVKAFVRMAVALPLVVVLAYLAVRYGLARQPFVVARGRRMRVLEQVPLGPKAFLVLVQVGRTYYLLACCEGPVTVIKEMDAPPEELEAEQFRLLHRWSKER